MTEATAILITLIVYKVVLIAIGLAVSKRTRSASDFFLGGRKLGPWVAALSASASSSSVWTLLGVSGFAYKFGVSSLWLVPACVGGFALNWFVVAPKLRRLAVEREALTVTDVLSGPRSQRGSRAVAVTGSVIILLSLLTYVAAQFQGAGKTFHKVFGLPMEASIFIGAGIIVLYTLLGGFWAVSLTDSLQGLLMAAAAVVLPVGSVVAVGGIDGMIQGIRSMPVEGFSSLTKNASLAAGAAFVVGLLGIGLGYPGQPHVVNRFMALRDEKAVGPARTVAMAWAVVTYIGMVVVGLCARILIPDPAALGDREVAFYGVAGKVFPPVIAGIMIASVLSATMSTADSQLLVASSSASHDLRGEKSSQPALSRSRWVVVALSAGAVVVALFGNKEIFSHVLFAWSAIGAAFGPLLLVTLLRGPVGPWYSLGAMISGFVLSVTAYSIPATSGTALERVFPFVVALVVALWGQRKHATAA